MNPSSRIKKVYHLRKTVTSKLVNREKPQQDKAEKQQSFNVKTDDNLNNQNVFLQSNIFSRKGQKQQQEQQNRAPQGVNTRGLVDGPQLSVDKLFLSFEEKLDCIQKKEIKVKNVGSSAIYYQWKFKNDPKINVNAVKDIKPKFFCHYTKRSINPGEEVTFIFSFVSQIPGYFTEQCQLICQPALITPIPVIRLQGKAYIDDEWKHERMNFLLELEESIRECHVHETVDDLIDLVKLPEPERPNVKDLAIAEEIFEKVNENLKLYFNPIIHSWFNELFEEVWQKKYANQENAEEPYWDQSIQTFKNFIINCQNIDDVERKCYLQRLEHYTYLSTFSLPNKSQLYSTVYNIVSEAAYHIGGDYADAAKKELDMWDIPFREPRDEQTQADLKARKEEVQKIKAEWLKRTKKKKWGEEEDKQMIEEFKNKVKAKANHEILSKFQGFENEAEYTKIQKMTQADPFNPENYFLFLSRMKTINQFSLEGKKVFLKFNLKLKDNCQKQLKELDEYLIKKEEEKKRLEEEKKNADVKKKKPAAKKKGHKEQEQQKPLTFDFSSILDEENWNGFLETFRQVQERNPFVIFIGCTYRQRIGRFDQNLTVAFLLEHIKTIDPSIQFMTHNQLFKIKQNLENETIPEGGIYLLENLNFLPCQTLNCEQIQVVEENGVQTHKKIKRNVLYPEIRNQLDQWVDAFDVIIDEDRFLPKQSGISSYSNIEVVLGKTWWNYVAYSQRTQHQTLILSGDFNPDTYLLLIRLMKYVKFIYLTGTLGLKFRMALQNLKELTNVKLNDKQSSLIKELIQKAQDKLYIPQEFKFLTHEQEGQEIKCIVKNLYLQGQNHGQELANCEFIDINDNISQLIEENHRTGHVFMINKSHVKEYDQNKFGKNSTGQIIKSVYKIQQQKRLRHSIEVNTHAGIDYNQDLVFYLIGIDEKYVQTIDLNDKKPKIISEDGQEEEQVQEPEDESDNEKKKIDLVADVKLFSTETFMNLLSAKFDYGLKNIRKYPKPRII